MNWRAPRVEKKVREVREVGKELPISPAKCFYPLSLDSCFLTTNWLGFNTCIEMIQPEDRGDFIS
jgi:hypothetical protein